MLYAFPRAIVHFDGDAFFASVEQAIDPSLKGKPVVTGKERGIIACASYEAKALGVKRGIPLHEAVKMCQQLIVLPSDYETYSLYSKRMFDIMRRFTPIVEEYSIDEGFADISGLRRVFHTSYEDIARQLQSSIQAELDITVSVGLSLSKSLAKLASKFRKPRGFTAVAGNHIHLFLQRTPLEKVWGFGPNTVQLLTKQGLQTAYDFVMRPEKWAERLMGKVGRELWNELRGNAVYPVTTEEKSTYATISKCKTFTAPSRDREFVYARLVRNMESAFIKLRRHKLRVRGDRDRAAVPGFQRGGGGGGAEPADLVHAGGGAAGEDAVREYFQGGRGVPGDHGGAGEAGAGPGGAVRAVRGPGADRQDDPAPRRRSTR